MAAPENRLTLDSDFIDPADEDWALVDDAGVWHAAQDGIPQAQAELERRESRRTRPSATARRTREQLRNRRR